MQQYLRKTPSILRFVCSKRGQVILFTLVCITVGSVISISQRLPVYATGPTLTTSITSSHYTPGLSTGIRGTGYQAKEVVNLYWNYTGPGGGSLLGTATAKSTGIFNLTITIPLTPIGTYTIAGVGQTSGLIATTSFQLLPGLTLSVVAEGIGTPLGINGQAFGAGETVDLYWNRTATAPGTFLEKVAADATGSFQSSFVIPSAPVTHIPIVGIGETSNASSSALFVPFPATLALGPLAGSAGSPITISGYGFQSSENVNIYWNNGATPVLTIATSQYGYIALSSITVPAGLPPGSYPVTAVGQISNITATTSFTVVTASSSLSLATAPVNAYIHVSGQEYLPGETVNIVWNYQGTPTTLASVTAGSTGTVNTSFTVPATTPGNYAVAVVGITSNQVSQNTLRVTRGLTSYPLTTPPGASVIISGTGFQPGETVQLSLKVGASTQPLATALADSSGNINQAVTIPAATAPGTYTLIGTGQSSASSYTTSTTIDTSWNDFGFDYNHTRNNIYENVLGASNAANLTLKWQTFLKKGLRGSAVYGNGVVYTSTYDGRLRAFSTSKHNQLWEFNSNTLFDSPAAPLFDPGTNTVFFGIEANAIPQGYVDIGVPTPFYGIDATTGKVKWSIIIPLNDFGFPTLYRGTVYFGGSNEGQPAALYALDALTGTIKWAYASSGGVWGASAIDPAANIIFTNVGNPAFQEVALNATTGAVIWQTTVPFSSKDMDPGSGIAVGNGLVYINSKNNYAMAFHESDGSLAWATQISTSLNDVSSPALSSTGVVYVGSLDGNLYALSAADGHVIWKTFTDAQGIDSSPALANGVVYAGTLGGNILALDASSGQILWTFQTQAPVYSSPIVVNGRLYCSSTTGLLYVFGL